MLQVIASEDAVQADDGVLGMIYGGKISKTKVWVETDSLLVRKCSGKPFGTYYVVVLTNDADENDSAELRRLEGELGKKLHDCVVERERYDKPHPDFPGSQYFYYVTVYAG